MSGARPHFNIHHPPAAYAAGGCFTFHPLFTFSTARSSFSIS